MVNNNSHGDVLEGKGQGVAGATAGVCCTDGSVSVAVVLHIRLLVVQRLIYYKRYAWMDGIGTLFYTWGMRHTRTS